MTKCFLCGKVKKSKRRAKLVQNSFKISEKFKVVIKNKGLKQEELARRMGVTKQAVSYVLNHRLDCFWSDKEIDYWCKNIRIDSLKFYELREQIQKES